MSPKQILQNSNRIGVLIISPFFPPNVGGVETHLGDLTEYLARENYNVFVLTYQPLTTKLRVPSFEKSQNVEIHRISWFSRNLFYKLGNTPLLEFLYLTPPMGAAALLFLLRNHRRISVIHCHGLTAAFTGKVLRRIFGKKVVVSVHAIYEFSSHSAIGKLVASVLASAESVVAVTRAMKNDLIRLGLSATMIKVGGYWIDQERFRPMNKLSCKKKLGLSHEFLVLFVGRLIEIKGVRVLVEVAAILKRDDVIFAFVGEGPLAEFLVESSRRHRNIRFLGRESGKELVEIYNAADLVVVPSLHEEGYGRVILEALSCGVPVAASSRGGIPEALDENVGWLVEPSPDKIASLVSELSDRRQDLEKMKMKCRAFAEAKFSQRNVDVIESCYRSN